MTTTTCLVSLALLAVASAVPASVKRWDPFQVDGSLDSCALTCKEQPNKFAYKAGTTYSYDYAVDTDTSMAGASEESAQLSIKARAEIQAIDGCDFALLLKDVKVSHTDAYTGRLRTSDREDEFQRVLEGSNLRFSFDDGVISSVCPESSETTWALNFKRGLLTAFQNSMESLDKNHKVSEVDVAGECEADFTVTSSWGWKKETRITKTKNLLTCSSRDSYKSMYQAVPYRVTSEIQSLPIMKGTHKCDYIIGSTQILQSALCEETHVYVPFSNHESGGKTRVQQTLTLTSQKNGVDAVIGPVKEHLTLLFQHEDVQEQIQNGPESLEQKLKEICDGSDKDVRPETPRLYSELVRIIKVLSKSELERAYKLVKTKSICPRNVRTLKFLMDALPVAGTDGAVALMTTLINNKQVDGILSTAWITSIALIQDPTISIVGDGLKLLQGPSSSDALLPVSALVNRYCKKADNCDSNYHISEIMTVLKNQVPSDCSVNDNNLKDVLKTLRAIGNMGQSSLTSTLDKCISSTTTPLEVKVAAADAYRRIPCDISYGQRDSTLWSVLQDASQDVELRITSYLSLMRCPDDDTLSQISQLLDKEADDHLGGFIYSHLKNLKETSDPLKQDIAKAISLHSFKEFDLNMLKYSSNHEASVLINRLNLGFTADSNVIMSSNSPLPRSAMLNLTADLFGNSVNLLEIGVRVEGLEILVEKFLGSSGYFPSKAGNKGDDKLNDVKGSIYARVFGNEILFQHAKGTQGLRGPAKMPNFLDILISLANKQDVAYTHSEQLMDVSLTVPTIAGLPLEITVNGSMNLDLKAEGKADLRSIATSPRSMEIDGEIRPSAALEITCTMAISALTTRMGLRMRNTMHSSTQLKGHIEINRGRVLNIEIQPPGDKMEIFNARSQFYIIHNDIEKEQNMIKDNYQEYNLCSGDKLATIFGVELCGELKFPNASSRSDSPYFPFTGPTSLNIMTYRRDTHTSYKLIAMRKETKQSSTALFMMDTPNSEVNRLISTDITIGYTPDKQIDVVIVSPWKKVNLNSALVANKDILSFVGSVLMDDKDKYGLTTEVKISKTGSNIAYAPFIQLTQAGRTDTLLSGIVNVDFPNKFDANLELTGYEMLPYTVEGSLVNQEQEKRVRLELSSQAKSLYVFNVGSTIDRSGKDYRNVKIEPTLIVKTRDQTLLSVTGNSDYKSDKSAIGDLTFNIYKLKPASVSWRIGQSGKSKQSNYNVDVRVKSSLLTGSVDGDVSLQRHVLSSKLQLTYNVPQFGTDVVTWNTKFNNRSKNTFKKYRLTSMLEMKKYTDYNIGLAVDLDHKKKQTDAVVDLKYGANPKDKKRVISIKSTINRENMSWKDADIGFQLQTQVPEKNVDLNMKMSHYHSDSKLDSNVNLKFYPYLKNIVDASISLQDKSNKLVNYAGQANLGIMGKKFVVSSELTQKSAKNYQHQLDIKDVNGRSHFVNTVYRASSSNGHEVSADVNINGYNPVQLQGKTLLDPLNFQASGSAIYGKDVYNISTQSKITAAVKKINFEASNPDRQVEAEIELKNFKEKASGSVKVDWDAKKSGKSVIAVDGSYRSAGDLGSRSISGTVNVKTPFNKLEDLSADASYSMDPSQYSTKGKMSWGGKQETLSSSLVVKRPFDLKSSEVEFMATTPIRQFREIELQINHKLEPTFTASVKGKLEGKKAELVVKGQNRGDYYNRDVYGHMELKTPFTILRESSVTLEHKDNGRAFKSLASLGYNQRKFDADLQMDHISGNDRTVNKGNLLLSWPEDRLQTTWEHSNVGTKQIKCFLESNWSGNRRVSFSLAGSNNVVSDLRHIVGTVDVTTPWISNREMNVKFESKLGAGKLESSSSVRNNGMDKIVYNIVLEGRDTSGNALFMVTSPLYDQKVHGETQLNWAVYPVTASAWFEWAPWARIDFDGSLSAPSVDDFELNTKLITPFTNFENVFAKASHKLDNSEYVSKASFNYGVRKAISFENRVRYDDEVKLLRTKLSTPCSYLKSLNTGVQLNTTPYKLEGSADFELLPSVKKYDGFVIWNYVPDNWNSQLRVNTPLRQLPYLQIKSWCKLSGSSLRTTHIDIEPSPYGVYSLDTSYKTDLPYQLDINLKTPHPQFDVLGLTATHNTSVNAVQSRLRVMYQSNKEIDSQLKLDWANLLDGSFIVTTPFKGYESNKILARHDSSSRGFNSHGEAHLGRKNVQGDIMYTSSQSATLGSVSLVSPVQGYEKLSANFKVQGMLNKLKGDASVNIGTDTLSTTFSNSITLGLLKSSVTLSTPYSKDLKLSVQHKDSRSNSETKFESTLDGQYGDKNLDSKLAVSYTGFEKTKVDLSINSPFKFAQISVENALAADKIYGKSSIQTDVASVGNLELIYDVSGPLQNIVSTISLTRNGESLVDTLVETSNSGDNIHGKVVTKGMWLPMATAQVDHKGIISDFSTKAQLSNSEGNIFDNEVTFKIEDSEVDIFSSLNYRYNSEDSRHSITIHKEGTLTNFKVDIKQKYDNEEVTAEAMFQAENQIKGLILINDLSSKYDKVGAEFEYSGDSEKLLTTGKITISSTQDVSGKVSFYRYNLQRIEASAEVITPWEGYRFSRVEYRHEGTDNRLSCSVNIQYGNSQTLSSDLVTQYSSTASNLSFNLKTPFSGYEEILLSGDFDSNQANGKAVLGTGMEFTVSGVYDPSVYPYHIQYQITTPLDALKKAMLNLKGTPLDGTVDLLVVSLNKKIEGNAVMKYSSPYKLSLTTQMTSNIQGWKLLQLNVRNDDDSKGTTSHLLVSWDPRQQVVVDGRYFIESSSWASKKEHVIELALKTPFEGYKSLSLDIDHSIETNNIQTVLSLELDQNKLVDLDVSFDQSSKYDYSAIMRKPWPLEYTTSYQWNGYTKEADVYFSWNRDEPSSNLRVKSSLQTRPSDNDRSVTVTLISPSRTVGVEHSLSSSADKLTSSGKLFWDQDDDSKLFYSLDVSRSNRRRDAAYNGDFKLGFPSRTFGLSGSLSNNDLAKTADAAFSWDLGRDDSKRLDVRTSFSGQEYTKADITLRLPANLQVDSSLILNQGNTIIDGKTDISYSREARKTLTLYSKLKNTPSSYSYFSRSGNGFNYSVELGLTHPETKVDVKIDSHVAKSDEFLTSSLGVRYMTVKRQMKNLALFAEIDRIRKQIKLVASGPSQSAGVRGTLVSEDPLSLTLLGSVDGQDKFKSTLDVNKGSKALTFEIGQTDNLLSLKAYYPNSSAIQAELIHKKDSGDNQEAAIGLRLVNTHLLRSRMHWRPAALGELQNFVADQVSAASKSTKGAISQMNAELRTELTDKYEEITASVVEDLKPLLKYIENEFESFATDVDNMKVALNNMHRNNEFYLQDISTVAVNNFDYVSQTYTFTQAEVQRAVGLYRDTYQNWIQAMLNKLEQIELYSFSESYNQVVTQGLKELVARLDGRVVAFIKSLGETDLKILERTQAIMSNVGDVYNHPQLDFIRKRVQLLRDLDYFYYVNTLNQVVRDNVDLKPYADVLYSVKDAAMNRAIPESVRRMVAETTNQIYQQAQLAYEHWDIEENLNLHLNISMELMKDIVEDELREYISLFMIRSPITLYDPVNGNLEANFVLPIEVKYLDQAPDLSQYVQQANGMYNKYAPNMDSLYQYYPTSWFNNSADDDQDSISDDNILDSLNDFSPSKSLKDNYTTYQI